MTRRNEKKKYWRKMQTEKQKQKQKQAFLWNLYEKKIHWEQHLNKFVFSKNMTVIENCKSCAWCGKTGLFPIQRSGAFNKNFGVQYCHFSPACYACYWRGNNTSFVQSFAKKQYLYVNSQNILKVCKDKGSIEYHSPHQWKTLEQIIHHIRHLKLI